MKILTSISPKHHNETQQAEAVASWSGFGYQVYSFNSKTECDMLRSTYPTVRFVETNRTMDHHFGKSFVCVNALIDWAKTQSEDCFLLINSDIILHCDDDILHKYISASKDGICIARRLNYDESLEAGVLNPDPFLPGFDAFLIHSKYLDLYPQSQFSLGNTHWDYWIPYTAIKANVPVIHIKENIIFHKNHPIQYDNAKWLEMGRYFRWDMKMYQYPDNPQGIAQMSEYIRRQFMLKMVEI
jgi:hypothetical protein